MTPVARNEQEVYHRRVTRPTEGPGEAYPKVKPVVPAPAVTRPPKPVAPAVTIREPKRVGPVAVPERVEPVRPRPVAVPARADPSRVRPIVTPSAPVPAKPVAPRPVAPAFARPAPAHAPAVPMPTVERVPFWDFSRVVHHDGQVTAHTHWW